jgi:hypothetical protein
VPIYIPMMMKDYKKIQPEVIVGLGDDTEFQEQSVPFSTIVKLHLKLEDWLGDDLMECYPCYIVTEYLKNLLETQSFKGFEFQEIKTTLDDIFDNNYQQNKPLPDFHRLLITGQKGQDDLFLDGDKILNVSAAFLDFLGSNVSLRYLEIVPERNEFDDLLDQMIAQSKASNDKRKLL